MKYNTVDDIRVLQFDSNDFYSILEYSTVEYSTTCRLSNILLLQVFRNGPELWKIYLSVSILVELLKQNFDMIRIGKA